LFTWRQGNGDYATDAAQRHGQTQGPSASPAVHQQPAHETTGYLHDGRQQKAQVLILSQRRTVIAQSDVYHVVGEPGNKNNTKTTPCASERLLELAAKRGSYGVGVLNSSEVRAISSAGGFADGFLNGKYLYG